MKTKKILRNMFKVFNPVNKIVPKKPMQIMFYSNLGFRDNVKAVYDYMVANNLNEKYEIICSCSDYKKYKSLNINNVRFVSITHGLFYFFTAKFFFYSFGKYPIIPTPEQIVINLWHGTPLKTIGNLNKTEKNQKQDYFTYVLAASPFFFPIMARSFNVDENRVLLCGHGRNDALFYDSREMREKFCTNEYRKVFFWLPTFRKQPSQSSDTNSTDSQTKLSIFTNWSALDDLDLYLKKLNALCIIKLHPLQEWDENCKCNYTHIKFFTHKTFMDEKLDLYKVLPIADALITDYSSVYFDYLLLDRPIAFIIDDMLSYSDTRGFVFSNPLEYMPGPKIQSKSEFLNFISDCMLENDAYREERKNVNEICNYYKDGKNCLRILQLTGIL